MKTNKVRLPSIASVRAALNANWRYLRRNFDRSEFEEPGEDFAGQDVRLQVHANGDWAVHVCPSDYDQDHRGYWGSSYLSYDRQTLRSLPGTSSTSVRSPSRWVTSFDRPHMENPEPSLAEPVAALGGRITR